MFSLFQVYVWADKSPLSFQYFKYNFGTEQKYLFYQEIYKTNKPFFWLERAFFEECLFFRVPVTLFKPRKHVVEKELKWNWQDHEKLKPSQHLPHATTAKTVCVVMLLINLRHPEWLGLDCHKPMFSETVCALQPTNKTEKIGDIIYSMDLESDLLAL